MHLNFAIIIGLSHLFQKVFCQNSDTYYEEESREDVNEYCITHFPRAYYFCDSPSMEVFLDEDALCKQCNRVCWAGADNRSTFNFHLKNNKTGTYEIDFKLIPKSSFMNSTKVFDPGEVEVELYVAVNGSLSKHSCDNHGKIRRISNWLRLSKEFMLYQRKVIELNWCKGIYENHISKETIPKSNCTGSKAITLKFDYLYTGCYYVFVKPNNLLGNIYSCPEYIETDYKKIDLKSKRPKLSHDHYIHPNKTMELSVRLLDHDNLTEVGLFPEVLTMMLTDHSFRNLKWSKYNEIHKMKEYKFVNLSYGNFCLAFNWNDERCRTDRSCGSKTTCVWVKDISLAVETAVQLKPPSESVDFSLKNNTNLFIFIFIMIIFIVVIFFIIYGAWKNIKLKYHQRACPNMLSNEQNTQIIFSKQNLLVLYPRDCDLFMEAMAKFKQVLEMANCTVFDYWDPKQAEQVACKPNEWLLSKIDDRSVKVVVVMSELSEIIKKALTEHLSVQYRQPESFDRLFDYGIQCLLNQAIVCYRNIIVVRLIGEYDFKEILHENLNHLNPFEEFKLPLHLERLLLNIHSIDTSKHKIVIDGVAPVQSFKEAVNLFSKFKNENPNYLSSIITINNNHITSV